MFDDQLILLFQLLEGAPSALPVGYRVCLHPTVAGIRVEIFAWIDGGVHGLQDVAGYVHTALVKAGFGIIRLDLDELKKCFVQVHFKYTLHE